MGSDWLNKKSLNWVWWIVDLPQRLKNGWAGPLERNAMTIPTARWKHFSPPLPLQALPATYRHLLSAGNDDAFSHCYYYPTQDMVIAFRFC